MDCSSSTDIGAQPPHVPTPDDASVRSSTARNDRYAGPESSGHPRPARLPREALKTNVAEPEVSSVRCVSQVGSRAPEVRGATETAAPRLHVDRRREGILASPARTSGTSVGPPLFGYLRQTACLQGESKSLLISQGVRQRELAWTRSRDGPRRCSCSSCSCCQRPWINAQKRQDKRQFHS